MESLCCSGKARTKKPATRAGFDVVRTLASAYSEEERLKFAPPSARWELRLQALKAFLPPPQTPVFLKVMNSSYKNITIDATNIEKKPQRCCQSHTGKPHKRGRSSALGAAPKGDKGGNSRSGPQRLKPLPRPKGDPFNGMGAKRPTPSKKEANLPMPRLTQAPSQRSAKLGKTNGSNCLPRLALRPVSQKATAARGAKRGEAAGGCGAPGV
jgi:hypothetical protein